MDDNKNNEEVILDIEEILFLSQGKDNGIAKSIATLEIESILENNKIIDSVYIESGSFDFSISGGCAVLQIDFEAQGMVEYRRILTVCDKWIEILNNDTSEDARIVLTLMPRITNGQILIEFRDLVFYQGITTGNTEKIILCFDNNQSEVYEMHDIDYRGIKKAIEDEARLEDVKLENELYAVKAELEELQNNNYYENSINEKYKVSFENNEEESQPRRKYGMRISQD